jgi:hypothetical protein
MPAYLSPIGNSQIVDVNGNPLNGGKIYTYLAGTSTPAGTWTTSAGAIAQTNPIILNSLGATANPIFLSAGVAYKFIIKDSTDVTTLYTFDNITGINDPSQVALSTPEWMPATFAISYVSATVFSATGDQTLTLPSGMRVKTTNTGGTAYSRVLSSVFSLGFTTVTLLNDSLALDSGLSALSYSILNPTKPSLPNSQAARDSLGVPYAIGRNILINSSFYVNQDNRTLSASNITLAANEYLVDGWRAGNAGAVVNFSGTYVTGDPRIITIVSGTIQCPFEWYRLQGLAYPCTVSWLGTSLGNIYDTNPGGGFANTPSLTSPFRSGFSIAPFSTHFWLEFGAGSVKTPQLELGNTQTPYEYKTAASELIECQRFYEPDCRLNIRQSSGPVSVLETQINYKVTKRAAPAITQNLAGTTSNVSGVGIGDITTAGFRYQIVATAANTDTIVNARSFKVDSRL